MNAVGANEADADAATLARALDTLETVILGKPAQIRLCLACLLARGHLLIEDVPGVGKTTLAHALAHVLGLLWQRVQFTSDLLPADIIGVSIFDRASQRFNFRQGPVFTQLLLADEVNRASPRTQSALLEAMEERQVSADGTTYPLPEPFFVVATQNPHEQLGTFALPESQLDRFLMRVTLGYPDSAHERELLRGGERRELLSHVAPALSAAAVLRVQRAVRGVHVAEPLLDYAQALIARTRERSDLKLGWNPVAPLLALARERAAAWMRRRQGADLLPVALERRRLYILPTGTGVAFAALLFLMLIAGLNYGNSLALFLTFLLGAFALVAMQQCHRNLLGIAVLTVSAPAVFARARGAVHVTLANPAGLARYRVEAALPESPAVAADLTSPEPRRLELPLPALRRGIVRIERLRLATAHPFGLFRAWTWLHVPVEMLVYPRPAGSLPMPAESGARPGARSRGGSEADEWQGLRPFRDGDSPRQVDWKAYAREAPLLVKEYSPAGSELRVFDFGRLTDPDVEVRLSQLARWVVDAEAHGERYGLALPGVWLPPDRGPEHRHRCLAALALFGTEGHAGSRPV
ncbi:MAG: DUF58 domain-containing protein [Gammaproteobacteria bacterium]|nr:MAG: DUF58 domain-containing protein [Gammaproteobacteria bacterium]